MKIRLFVLLAVLTAVLVTTIFTPTTTRPVQAQTNLLRNPGFEEGYYNQDNLPEIATPNGWRMHWLDGQRFGNSAGNATRPETVVWYIEDAPLDERTLFFRDGAYVLKVFKNWGPIYAGLAQDVTGLTVGRRYRFSVPIFIDFVESYEGGKQPPEKLDSGQVRLGAGPTGTRWQDEVNIQYTGWWSAMNIQPFYLAYPIFVHEFTATSPNMTVWVDMASLDPYVNAGFFLDGLSLVALDSTAPVPANPNPATGGDSGAAVAQPAGPTATPEPSPTPRADGAVVHIVQAGDSFWGLAIQYAGVMGLTPEEAVTAIQELNNNPTFINPGDELIIVPPNAAPTPEPTVAITATLVSTATVTPLVEATAVPTATAVSAGSSVCVTVYADTNEDGQHDEANEPLLADVGVSLFQGGRTIATYISDGNSDPYCFEALSADTYQVQAYPPSGYRTTTPESWAAAISEGMVIPVAFGLVPSSEVTAPATSDAEVASVAAETTVTPADAMTAEESGGFLANAGVIVLIAATVLILIAGIGVYLLRRG
jgi:hypothetical protein